MHFVLIIYWMCIDNSFLFVCQGVQYSKLNTEVLIQWWSWCWALKGSRSWHFHWFRNIVCVSLTEEIFATYMKFIWRDKREERANTVFFNLTKQINLLRFWTSLSCFYFFRFFGFLAFIWCFSRTVCYHLISAGKTAWPDAT